MIAWLTCLTLAFLACMLGVFNLGRQGILERDLDRVRKQVAAGQGAAPTVPDGELSRMRDTVLRLRREVAELRAAQDQLPEQMQERLDELQGLLDELQKELGPAAGETAP